MSHMTIEVWDAAGNKICVGDHWIAVEHEVELPLDEISLLVAESDPEDEVSDPGREEPSGVGTPPPRVRSDASAPAAAPVIQPRAVLETVTVTCPNCSTEHRLAAETIGKRARCRGCQTVFTIAVPGDE